MAFRDVILWFMGPKTKAAAEAESRKWIATCPSCGKRISVWDLGGIRYKAAGKPWQGFRCQACGKWGMHQVAYDEKGA